MKYKIKEDYEVLHAGEIGTKYAEDNKRIYLEFDNGDKTGYLPNELECLDYKPLYEEYLGKDYHNRIRKMLTLPAEVLPNSVIDADLNIGGMKQLLSPALDKMMMLGNGIDTEEKYNQLQNAGIYYLCGVLCRAMKSRTSAPPFNLKKYQKNWDKKQKGYMQKGNMLMQGLMIG